MELAPEERRKWIDPIVIDTEEDAEKFIQALERAAAAPTKNVTVVYQDVVDGDEIKQIFN